MRCLGKENEICVISLLGSLPQWFHSPFHFLCQQFFHSLPGRLFITSRLYFIAYPLRCHSYSGAFSLPPGFYFIPCLVAFSFLPGCHFIAYPLRFHSFSGAFFIIFQVLFHSLPGCLFIGFQLPFHCLSTAFSFLLRRLFHCFPAPISYLFHYVPTTFSLLPGSHFIAYPLHFHSFPGRLFIASQLPFHCFPPTFSLHFSFLPGSYFIYFCHKSYPQYHLILSNICSSHQNYHHRQHCQCPSLPHLR